MQGESYDACYLRFSVRYHTLGMVVSDIASHPSCPSSAAPRICRSHPSASPIVPASIFRFLASSRARAANQPVSTLNDRRLVLSIVLPFAMCDPGPSLVVVGECGRNLPCRDLPPWVLEAFVTAVVVRDQGDILASECTHRTTRWSDMGTKRAVRDARKQLRVLTANDTFMDPGSGRHDISRDTVLRARSFHTHTVFLFPPGTRNERALCQKH